MSNNSRRRRNNIDLPQNWWIFVLIFILFLITPAIVSGKQGDSSSGWWIALVCIMVAIGLMVLAGRLLIPLIQKGIKRGVAEVKKLDSSISTYQRTGTMTTSVVSYNQTQQTQAVATTPSVGTTVITPVPGSSPLSTTGHMVQGGRVRAALPLPNQWEQLRRQLLFLGGDDEAITKTAALTTALIIEDLGTGRVAAGRLLFEQLLKKAGEVSVCLVTTSDKYNNLAEQFENIYLVGSPQAKRSLPVALQESYGGVDEHNVDHFCRTLVEESDHAILDLSTYSDEGVAAQVLLNVMYGIYGHTSTNTNRQCILILDGADQFLPIDENIGAGLFANQGKAQGLREDFIRLITTGNEIGLYTYMITSEPTALDGRALLACRLWIVNKTLTVNETALVCGRTRAAYPEIQALHEGKALLTEETGMSPVKMIMLRKPLTAHLEPLEPFHWGKPRKTRERQSAPSPSPVSIAQPPAPSLSEQRITQTQHAVTSTSTTMPIAATGPISTESSRSAAASNTQPVQQKKPQPKWGEYVCYTKFFLSEWYSIPTLMRPPEELMPLVELLDLAERYAQRGIVIGDYPVRAIMHRTEDVPEWAQKVANDVRKIVLDYQAQQESEAEQEEATIQHSASPLHRNEAPLALIQQQLPLAVESEVVAEQEDEVADVASTWKLPGMHLFTDRKKTSPVDHRILTEGLAATLRETLRAFKVDADVLPQDISVGPTVIRLGIRPTGKPEMEPDPDDLKKRRPKRDLAGNIVYETRTRVSKIMALQNDLALVLEAKTIRMEAPVPGRPFVGVEIPNKESCLVTFREIIECKEYKEAKRKSKLAIPLGKDVEGIVRVGNLARMPHLLIAGATGSGKSVIINIIIASLTTQATPDDVRLLMVDPKMVELNMYDGIPHLLSPVVTKVEKVVPLLKNAINEMERRYRLFSQLGVRNLDGYRKLRLSKISKGDTSLANLPAIVIIIDELADLMMAAPEEVEGMICRLAQLARATGIHLVIATQRPSVDVITGLIKANIPTRISFMVSSAVDSRTIIDMGGAERLLGRGDMLYLPAEAGRPDRIQGAFLSDEEAHALADYWRRQVIEHAELLGMDPHKTPAVEEGWELKEEPAEDAELDDDLLDKAEEIVREYGRATISLLQRRLRVGYSRAARLIDLLEERGIIGQPESGGRNREVYESGSQRDQSLDKENRVQASETGEEDEPTDEDEEDEEEASRREQRENAGTQPVQRTQEIEEATVKAAAPLTPSETLALLLGENLAQWLPALEQLAQGERFTIKDGRNLSEDVLQLLATAFTFQRGEISKTTVEGRFGVGFSKANKAIEYLEDMGIISKYGNNSKPRTLTENRGGDRLPPLLRAVRDLVDSYQGTPIQQDDGDNEEQEEGKGQERNTGDLVLDVSATHIKSGKQASAE